VNLPLLGARVLRDDGITLDPHNFDGWEMRAA
jgi:hypothetical protein